MRLSISYGFGNENRYNLSTIPKNIQLAMFKSEHFWNNKEKFKKQLQKSDIFVNVVHLPLDTLKRDPGDILEMIDFFKYNFGCRKYVVHPNKLITQFLSFIKESKRDIIMCVENFQWRKKKVMRSPLEIIDWMHWINKPDENRSVMMALDTSHTEEIWFDHKILPHLLKYTSVIHLSNRIGKKSHLPFNISGGDLNLVGFLHQLNRIYKWDGDIVLEYMAEYQDKLFKNYQYINNILEGKL